jgi:hypothetical protein
MRRIPFFVFLIVLATASCADARGLPAPRLATPADHASVQQLPALSWNAIRGAAQYEYQLAADRRFNSIALGTGTGKGTSRTHNLSAALDSDVPDGTYYWRVRGVSSTDRVGSWSRVRRLVKAWTTAPQLTGGNGAAVNWPSTPLVLRWSSVPYATKYVVSIATDPALSNVVLGSASQPTETQGMSFALPVSLAPGAYYWAVTPLDAEGHRGARSQVTTFQWTWPTTTATSVTDLNPDPRVFDPMFSWNPVPGAARYEVEVNSAEGFPLGSKWCCTGTTTGTSLAPLQVLANNSYYWRVRAIDAKGNAGVWNSGQSFTKAFDPLTPSVPNLTLRDVNGNGISGVPSTDTPIVTWDPVPGASRYEVQLGLYTNGLGCDWSLSATRDALHAFTATTAWTPLGVNNAGHQGFSGWPTAQSAFGRLENGISYCVRVLARSDNDAQGREVVSSWTQINGSNQPAFNYVGQPAPGPPGPEGLVTPNSAYLHPAFGETTPRTPAFTWNRVAGAQGYFVVIARDPGFTEVADVGFTDIPAYAPRVANGAPLSDETTGYYWAVIPTQTADGFGVFSTPCYSSNAITCGSENDNPQVFNKFSGAPEAISPPPGAAISTQPTFQWSPAENARTYHLQVSQDPTFGHPIDDVTTDATAYTSSSTYPADTVVYWRVRANDWSGQGLNWSPTRTFVRRLPVPSPVQDNPNGGPSIPPLVWSSVQGAISYDVHLEEPNGLKKDFTFEAPSATVVKYYGTGIWRWQVRAEFPTGPGGRVPGGYSAPLTSLLTLAPPGRARGVKAGARMLISWNPEPDAKQYQVELSTTNGFNSRIESHRVDGTSWAPNIDLAQKQNRGTLYWRVAAVDWGGNVGSFATGVFRAPRAPACPSAGKGHKKHGKRVVRCPIAHKHKATPHTKRHG